jgi:hypothetical protein
MWVIMRPSGDTQRIADFLARPIEVLPFELPAGGQGLAYSIPSAESAAIGAYSVFRSGAPRPMKMSTIASPCRYDAAARHALQSVNLRQLAILRCASPVVRRVRARSASDPVVTRMVT